MEVALYRYMQVMPHNGAVGSFLAPRTRHALSLCCRGLTTDDNIPEVYMLRTDDR